MMRIVEREMLSIPTRCSWPWSWWPSCNRRLACILILVVALTSWLTTSRLVRRGVLLRVREYVQAMKVMGGGGSRAVLRHIAPNAIGTIMVNATFQVADAIALVVAPSYLGLASRRPAGLGRDAQRRRPVRLHQTVTGG